MATKSQRPPRRQPLRNQSRQQRNWQSPSPSKKPVRRQAKPAEPETVKVLAVKNGESNVMVNTTKPDIELDKAKAAGLVVEAPNSITPEQAEKIAERRRDA
jgi:hypothetical protein